MSKIIKALEKARSSKDFDLIFDESASTSESVNKTKKNIIYSKTKILPNDALYLEKNRILTSSAHPRVKDYYSLLRTQIQQRTDHGRKNTIMVTSTESNEGKTTTAINLAISIASQVHQTTLLVDMDLRDPDISYYLGLEGHLGITDHFVDEIPLENVLVNPSIKNLVVLPAGKALSGSTEILSSPKMEQMVKELKHRYPDRYVIFDCPYILNNPDALVFSSYVDGVIFVVQPGKTTKDKIQKALSLIDEEKILGIVINYPFKT